MWLPRGSVWDFGVMQDYVASENVIRMGVSELFGSNKTMHICCHDGEYVQSHHKSTYVHSLTQRVHFHHFTWKRFTLHFSQIAIMDVIYIWDMRSSGPNGLIHSHVGRSVQSPPALSTYVHNNDNKSINVMLGMAKVWDSHVDPHWHLAHTWL